MSIFTEVFLQSLDASMIECAKSMSAFCVTEFIQIKNKQISSQMKGQLGESWLYDILKVKMPECEIVKCAAVKWSGDFIIKKVLGAKTLQIMVDVKNYSTAVPKDEVAKFHRDMEVRGYDAGLLLSMGTRFVGQVDDDMIFSIASHGGRDVSIVLLNTTSETLVVQTLRYLFSISRCDKEIQINAPVIKNLQDIRTRLSQMSRLRYEIGLLGTQVATSLSKLSHEILDIEVRTTALLDSIFNNIDQQTYQICRQEQMEKDAGVQLRSGTLKVLLAVTDEIKISDDKKFIMIGKKAVITRMATKDKISINCYVVKKIPMGDFTFRDNKLSFDLTDAEDFASELLLE